jgi:5-formyltetrahydrofolate cyclo-ligase
LKKKELRQYYLHKRNALSKKEIWSLTDAITDQLKYFNWSSFKCVSLFLPITALNEIDTFEIISYFKNNYNHIKIAVPRTNFIDLSLEHVLFTPLTVLVKNKYNIPEPLYGSILASEDIDVVFVPLLTFDWQGNRVGYGKGIYDRFLSTCKPDTLKIGLSLFEPESLIEDTNIFDIRLSHCITPNKVFAF